MCLAENTVKSCKKKYVGNPFSEDDYVWAEQTYSKLWKHLDHRRNYCINPQAMIGELLRRHNKNLYDCFWPKSKEKSDNYNLIMIQIMEAAKIVN